MAMARYLLSAGAASPRNAMGLRMAGRG